MRLAIFDADDVLIDSLDEVAITGYSAYTIFSGRGKVAYYLTDLPPGIRESLERHRPKVKGPPELLAFMKLMDEGGDLEKFEIRFTDEEKRRFQDILFDFRENQFTENREAFAKAVRTYEEACRQFKELQEKEDVETYIVTNRDKKTVRTALIPQDISIEVSRIYGGAMGMSKKERVLDIIRKHDANPASALYADDNIDLLLSLDIPGLHRYLALWGCRDTGRIPEAEARGIIPIEQDEILRRFLE